MTRARITISIPSRLVEAADERAEALHRSRSWVMSEAVRAYLSGPSALVAREAPVAWAAGPGPSRLAQLEADMALTPEERVASAEETALIAELTRPRPRRDQVLVFDSIEEFHAWERGEAIGG